MYDLANICSQIWMKVYVNIVLMYENQYLKEIV